jgi:hypothetical protein
MWERKEDGKGKTKRTMQNKEKEVNLVPALLE